MDAEARPGEPGDFPINALVNTPRYVRMEVVARSDEGGYWLLKKSEYGLGRWVLYVRDSLQLSLVYGASAEDPQEAPT